MADSHKDYAKGYRGRRGGRMVGASEQADAISTAKPRRKIKKRAGTGHQGVTGGGAVTNTIGRR